MNIFCFYKNIVRLLLSVRKLFGFFVFENMSAKSGSNPSLLPISFHQKKTPTPSKPNNNKTLVKMTTTATVPDKCFVVMMGTSHLLYSSNAISQQDYMMIPSSIDSLLESYNTNPSYVASEHRSKQLVIHRASVLTYLAIVSHGVDESKLHQQHEEEFFDENFGENFGENRQFDGEQEHQEEQENFQEVDENPNLGENEERAKSLEEKAFSNGENVKNVKNDVLSLKSSQNDEENDENEEEDDDENDDEETVPMTTMTLMMNEPVMDIVETEAALFRQLCLLHDLVCFRLPMPPEFNAYQLNFNSVEAFHLLRPLVESMKNLTYTHQSLLVQGIEFVELGHDLRNQVTELIQKVIQPHGKVLHAVLFVGTKLATVCSRPNSWVLSPRDLLCLLIYIDSLYQVSQAEEVQNQKQERERQQQQQEQQRQQQQQQQKPSNDEETAPDLNENTVDEDEEEPQYNYDQHQHHPAEDGEVEGATTDDHDNNVDQQNSSVFDHLYFTLPRYGPHQCGVFSKYDRKNNMTLLLIYDPKIEQASPSSSSTMPMDASTSSSSQEEVAPMEPYKQDLTNLAHSIYCELAIFSSFLRVKAQTHIRMVHYLHYCPGIIHFLFVDRIRNRVIAPQIVSLFNNSNSNNNIVSNSSQKNNNNGLNTDTEFGDSKRLLEHISVHFLRRKVWEMVQTVQQHRDAGYTEVGIGGLGVQYWFKEWIEDEYGNELKFMDSSEALDGFAHARAHYELYTMYLPFVPTQAIAHYNKILTHVLLDRPLDKLMHNNK